MKKTLALFLVLILAAPVIAPVKPLLGLQINWGHPLARGLVGCWLLNEGSGNMANDLSGNGNTFDDFANGTPEWRGEGINFVRADDEWITCNNPKIPALGNNPYTVIVGARLGAITNGSVLFSFDTYNPAWFVDDSGKLEGYDGGSMGQSTGVYTQGKMQQYGFVRYSTAAGGLSYYIDGVSAGTGIHNSSLIKPSKIQIGNQQDSASGWECNGLISYVRIWNRSLSASEIHQLYREPFCIFERIPIWMIKSLVVPVGGQVITVNMQ